MTDQFTINRKAYEAAYQYQCDSLDLDEAINVAHMAALQAGATSDQAAIARDSYARLWAAWDGYNELSYKDR